MDCFLRGVCCCSETGEFHLDWSGGRSVIGPPQSCEGLDSFVQPWECSPQPGFDGLECAESGHERFAIGDDLLVGQSRPDEDGGEMHELRRGPRFAGDRLEGLRVGVDPLFEVFHSGRLRFGHGFSVQPGARGRVGAKALKLPVQHRP